MTQTIVVAPPSLKEALEQINAERKDYVFRPTKHVFYPINMGFFVDESLLSITRNSLSSLVVVLPEVGTNHKTKVQVKRISMPHKGETVENYLGRIDSILKELDDHAKFFEL